MDQVMKTSAELSVLVPEVWSRKYYDTLLASLPFNSVISKDYEGEIQSLGDRVKISTIPEFGDADEVAEGQRVDADSVTVTQQSLIINKRIAKDFIVTNKAMLQSLPFMDKMRDLAIYSIQKKIQKLIIAESVPVAGNALSYDTALTLALADILEAKEKLDEANVPMSDRHMVMGSGPLNDIYNITGFTSSDFITSGAPLQTGELPPALLGFMPHFTTAVSTKTYLFHSSYITMAAQQGLSVKEFDLGVDGVRAVRVNIDTLMGLELLDASRVATLS